jgi:hypothetical protein
VDRGADEGLGMREAGAVASVGERREGTAHSPMYSRCLGVAQNRADCSSDALLWHADQAVTLGLSVCRG